jgi:hypothetical protein
MLKNEHYRKLGNMMHSAPIVKLAGARGNEPWSSRYYSTCGAKTFSRIHLPIYINLITIFSGIKICNINNSKSITIKQAH